MRSQAELQAFLRDELAPADAALARRRAAALATIPWVWIAVAAAVGMAASFLLRSPAPLALPIGWAVVVWRKAAERHRNDVKRTLVARVLRFWDPTLGYDPGRCVDEDTFRASGLFRGTWNHFAGEDFVSGTVGVTRFHFSELRVGRKGKKGAAEVVFSGLFFVAEFNKRFRGRTVLLPDRAERTLGTFGRALQKLALVPGCSLVELEDPAFERLFSVYASDPVEARYILSPSLMERIRRFRENASCALRIAFVDDHLFLAMPLETNLFEAAATGAPIDLATIQTWVGELGLATGIVEDLDLNTRIWSKGAGAPDRARTA